MRFPNKRGISQALSPGEAAEGLRRATIFDCFDISDLVVRSISRLCAADHAGDPDVIAGWTADATAARVRAALQSPGEIWVMSDAGKLVAVGGVKSATLGEPCDQITLQYVDPEAQFQGYSARMLSYLEMRMAAQGTSTARVRSPQTSLAFYRARGWVVDGPVVKEQFITVTPLRKSLKVAAAPA